MLLTVFVAMVSFGLRAQGPGAFIGGNVGFSRTAEKLESGSNSTDGPVTTEISLSPTLGYFIRDNIAVGARILLQSNRISSKLGNQDLVGISTGVGIDLFARYHKELGSGGNTFLFGEFDLGFGSITGKTEFGSNSSKSDPVRVVGAGLSTGVLYFPTDKLGVEVGLGHLIGLSRTTVTNADDNDEKEHVTSFDFLNLNTVGLSVGLFYYFNR